MVNGLKEKIKNTPLEARISIAYAFCSILQQGISLITLPLFTRMLSVEQYGQATIYSSWNVIITIFITLNCAYGSFSKAMVKFEDRRDEYIASVQGITLSFAAVFLCVYLPFQSLWNRLFELPTYVVCFMIIDIIATSSIALWSGKKRFEMKYISVIVVTLCVSLLSPIMQYFAIINFEEKGFAKIIAGVTVTGCFGLFLFVKETIKGKRLFNKELWKYALGFNVPLIMYYLSQVVFNQSDRIMISHFCGTGKAAIYGVAYGIATILTFVLNAINNAYTPWFYGKIKTGRMKDNQPIACYIAILMATLLLGVIWLAPEIILILAGRAYEEAMWIVPPVAMSILLLFYSQLFIDIQFYFERKKSLVFASIGAAILNIVLNAILIPVFGYYAAGYTTFASYIVFAVSNYVAMRRMFKEEGITEKPHNNKGLILILIVFMCLGFVGMALYKMFLARIIVALVGLVIIFLLRKKILSYWNLLKERDND